MPIEASAGGLPLERTGLHVRDSVRGVRIQHRVRRTAGPAHRRPGGVVAKKKYDPLWEVAGEKVALQGQGPDVDVVCPHCNVKVHVPATAGPGDRFACGLCGGISEVVSSPAGIRLEPVVAAKRS